MLEKYYQPSLVEDKIYKTWEDDGDLVINGRPALKFRMTKKDVDEDVNVVKKKGKDGGDYRDYDAEPDSDWEQPSKGENSKFVNQRKIMKLY